ncbi:MAG: metallo-beta-lactamase superfamily hydrolase, partial [Bacteroidetes bacterium]|nr:metallo-beta-lactamase superfamily hydrolase [Bacteroidota bacterium]
MDRLRFRSLASGSSGNCYFLGTASYGILIDAGMGIRTIRHFLRTMGLDFSNIWGLFITHDHADHIRAAGVIGEKHKVPVYTTKLIHNGINKSYCV